MPSPATFRDSTEIVLRCDELDAIREDLEREFTVTVVESEGGCRVVGSPVVIKRVGEWLGRRGLAVA